ncbi:MAG: hypothetical protein QXS17_03290 [Candidatus Micrarchaeaceae archaeon]
MSNFDEIMELVGRAEKIMDKVDESFVKMSRGGVMSISVGTTALVGNLRKANKIFKKLDKLTKAGGDTYTDEEKQIIEEKARELTQKYTIYYELIDKANEIAKGFVKSAAKAPVDAIKDLIGKKNKTEGNAEDNKEG